MPASASLMPFVTYTYATCLISSSRHRPVLDEPEILVFLGCSICLNPAEPRPDSCRGRASFPETTNAERRGKPVPSDLRAESGA